MSWRSKGLPLAIIAIFLLQISAPLFQFPPEELQSKQTSEAVEVGFSTGSGHDLEGDVINVDGKNWTVRGESILDYWSHHVQNMTNLESVDIVVTASGLSFACSISIVGNDGDMQVDFHTIHPNGSIETLLVESLSENEQTEDCAIGVTNENRIQVVYDIEDTHDGTDGHIRLARLAEENAVYLGRTWHIRTIAENIYLTGSESLNLEFDSESRTHLFFKDNTNGLRHMYFNKAFWNQSLLDEGPIGNDLEVKIDSQNVVHLVYTYQSTLNVLDNEVRLLRFNDTFEIRQVLARGTNISSAVGMDLDSNSIEQIAYSISAEGMNDVALLRSLAGKDTGRINPAPSNVITYDDDSLEGELLSGDLNGDAMDDLVYTDPEGNGTISIHYGSASGPGSMADRILVGSYSDSNLGTGIAIGDFNCDGYDDLASSEPGMANNSSGYISIRLGDASGISTDPWWEMNGSVDDNLGWSMTSLGDVESDGCDDLAVVADKMIEENVAQPTLSKNGLVMILKGNSSSMIFHANITQTDAGTMFGRQIAAGGDIDGDGFLDMAVSNTGTKDSPMGYSSVEFFMGDELGINTTAVAVHSVAQQGKLYGFEMAFVGDIHADGYDDIIISELFASTNPYQAGKVHMWVGSENGPVENWSLKGPDANALLGYTISPAGDINEDGYDDFMLMSPSASKSGTVNLYLGSQNGPRSDVQLFAQGSSGQNVGLNLLTGIDLDGDGMGDLVYSSRDLTKGESFAPVLTVMSERDWENINFGFHNQVTGIELHTPLRGSPSLLIRLNDSSLMLLENTPDGQSSAGRWDHRYLVDVDSAVMGITDAGKPTILAIRTISGTETMVTLNLEGNTGLDYRLDTGTGVGKEMGSVVDSNGMQRVGHISPTYSSIFYTAEGEYGYSTSLVRSSIDILYPIEVHVDSNDSTRMVYVDDDDNMVRLATLDGTWSEESILNTTIGDDFDSVWTHDNNLIFAQVAISNNSSYLQLVEYDGSNYTVSNVTHANLSASFELELVSGKLVLSVLDGEYLRIYERNMSEGNWTTAHQRWMLQDSLNENNTLVMNMGYAIYDSNNSDQGIIHRDSQGSWDVHSIDIPDSGTEIDFLVDEDRWHITSTNSELVANNLVWTTGTFSDSTMRTSTVFTSIVTEHKAAMELIDGDIVIVYSQSSTNNFNAMRIVSDMDRDLIPDTHDALPHVGNQWEDTDSDGFGDNPLGPHADACVSDFGESIYDRFGCDDYDDDGWSDVNDDCVSDDGTSWWGQWGCSDDDQDGWVDDAILGDRFPENWKQSLDTDRDTFGDNHGPDCCYVELEGLVRPGDYFPYNSVQYADQDGDGYGDNPDDPIDGDWCWFVEGYSWRDRQGCPDSDGDGASDPWYADNQWGTQYTWTEEDGADWWPEDGTQWADSDGDGYGDNSSEGATLPDKFPTIPAAAVDTDNDGYPNNWTSLENGTNHAGLNLDNCPNIAGNSTTSINAEGAVVGYYGCIDTDGDGRDDFSDVFPQDPTQVADTDGDGWGDNPLGNDPDMCPDAFGYINGTNPDDPDESGIGCPIPGEEPDDFDEDGVANDLDDCNNTELGQSVNEVGCSEFQIDDDLDGVSNGDDMCPDTPVDFSVDSNGCSALQNEFDSDDDGVNDPDDLCPDTDLFWIVNPASIDSDGCAPNQLDDDGDGVTNDQDGCPDTEPGLPVTPGGCYNPLLCDLDVDGDGYQGQYYYFSENDTHVGDAFCNDATQWQDMDGDDYGDNMIGETPDSCIEDAGNSTMKFQNGETITYYGCIDTDGDGYSDDGDKFPLNPTQWADEDFDDWGDNPNGTDADQCLGTNSTAITLQQAKDNFGCSLSQSDTDGDNITDDRDACPDTPSGVEVYINGCKKEVEAEPEEESDTIMGMEPMIFFAVVGGGGLLLIGVVLLILRSRNDDFDFDDDDDDEEWFEDGDDNDDFMASILGGRGQSRNQQRGPDTGPSRGPAGPGPSRGPPGANARRGPPGANTSRGPPGAGPSRGPSGPSRGPPGGPSRGPDPRGPARGPARSPATTGSATGKKVAKRKPLTGDGKVRKAKVMIDPDLFDNDELADKNAAMDWTRSALKEGQSERSILMQLQTTGWSAPQSRAIIDLSKQ